MEEAYSSEATVSRYMFTIAVKEVPFAFKVKAGDPGLPKNFEVVCSDFRWTDAIDQEYAALGEGETCKLIPFEVWMRPVSFPRDFRIKDTPGTEVPVLS